MSNSYDPMGYTPPGFSVHGISKARILEWIVIPFSRGSAQLSDWTQVSCIAGRVFTVWVTREVHIDFCFFWNSFAFSMIQNMMAIWSLVPLTFLNPACTSVSSQFTCCWNLTWRILSTTLLACEMSVQLGSNLNILWHCLSMELESKQFFYSYGHCWVFKFADILSAAL